MPDVNVLVIFNCSITFQQWLKPKGKQLINRMYRIMLGQEDIPETERSNHIMKGDTYMDKVLSVSIKKLNKDKNR